MFQFFTKIKLIAGQNRQKKIKRERKELHQNSHSHSPHPQQQKHSGCGRSMYTMKCLPGGLLVFSKI
jgi:hypothetical protein